MDTGVAALLDLLGDTCLHPWHRIPEFPQAEPEPAPSTVPPPPDGPRAFPDRAEPSGARTSWPGCVRIHRRASSSSTTPKAWCIPSRLRPTWSAPRRVPALCAGTSSSRRAGQAGRSWRDGGGCRSASKLGRTASSQRAEHLDLRRHGAHVAPAARLPPSPGCAVPGTPPDDTCGSSTRPQSAKIQPPFKRTTTIRRRHATAAR